MTALFGFRGGPVPRGSLLGEGGLYCGSKHWGTKVGGGICTEVLYWCDGLGGWFVLESVLGLRAVGEICTGGIQAWGKLYSVWYAVLIYALFVFFILDLLTLMFHTPDTCSLCVKFSRSPPSLHYVLLTSAFFNTYSTPDNITLSNMCSWPLHTVYYVLQINSVCHALPSKDETLLQAPEWQTFSPFSWSRFFCHCYIWQLPSSGINGCKNVVGSSTCHVPSNQWHHPAPLICWPRFPSHVNKVAIHIKKQNTLYQAVQIWYEFLGGAHTKI